jgi:hypothetical protein
MPIPVHRTPEKKPKPTSLLGPGTDPEPAVESLVSAAKDPAMAQPEDLVIGVDLTAKRMHPGKRSQSEEKR